MVSRNKQKQLFPDREQRRRYEPRQREEMSLIIYEQIGDGGGQWKTVASLFLSALHAFLLFLVLL